MFVFDCSCSSVICLSCQTKKTFLSHKQILSLFVSSAFQFLPNTVALAQIQMNVKEIDELLLMRLLTRLSRQFFFNYGTNFNLDLKLLDFGARFWCSFWSGKNDSESNETILCESNNVECAEVRIELSSILVSSSDEYNYLNTNTFECQFNYYSKFTWFYFGDGKKLIISIRILI